jgi:hypothetical protein
MKWLGAAMLLLLVGVPTNAQRRAVEVRLFWLRPPSTIRVTPQGASWRTCETCAASPLKAPMEIAAKASGLTVNSISYGVVVLTGRFRISGDGFSAFNVEDELRIEAREDALLLTLKMPQDEYVTAVLQGESASFHSDDALKAMGVAARTFAVRFGSRHRLEGFDFCDTTHCQDLRLGNESPRARAAVTAREGEVLWYEGRPAATYYHAVAAAKLRTAARSNPVCMFRICGGITMTIAPVRRMSGRARSRAISRERWAGR